MWQKLGNVSLKRDQKLFYRCRILCVSLNDGIYSPLQGTLRWCLQQDYNSKGCEVERYGWKILNDLSTWTWLCHSFLRFIYQIERVNIKIYFVSSRGNQCTTYDYNCHRYGLALTKQKFWIVPYSQRINFNLEIAEVDNFLLAFSLKCMILAWNVLSM